MTVTGPDEQAYYRRMLKTVAEHTGRLSESELCLFPTHVGRGWDSELMVYGRAVNGWDPRFERAETSTSDGRSTILQRALLKHEPEHCPMEWIANPPAKSGDYSTARSAFWRVTRDVYRRSGASTSQTATWSTGLAWGNLYRIAPGATGNPSGTLQKLQRDECIALLHTELLRLRPKRLLMLTGMDWAAPFLTQTRMHSIEDSTLAQAHGVITLANGSTCAVVVARHPQGKPHEKFVRDVSTAFGLGE